MTGVTYTGNYQTVDDYNPYKYTSQAPFGAENVRSYRYRGLIRDPNRKKSTRRDYSGVRKKAIKEMLGFGAEYTPTTTHFIDNRVSEGKISEKQGQQLKKIVNDYDQRVKSGYYDYAGQSVDGSTIHRGSKRRGEIAKEQAQKAMMKKVKLAYTKMISKNKARTGPRHLRADYTESGNVAADVMVGYEWTIFDMGDDEVDNDELIALIDAAVQDHIIYEYENERDPSSQGVTYVNYVNEDEKVEELNVYYRYDVNVELGAEDVIEREGYVKGEVAHTWTETRPKKDIEVCPDFRKNMDNCYLKSCKVCAKEGRTPEALQKLRKTGWFRQDGTQKGITDHDFGIQTHSRRPQQLPRGDDYNLGEYDSEGYQPEPLNMQGAVGVLMAIAGVLILKL